MNRPRSRDDARRVAFVFAGTAAAALTVANLVPRLLLADADARLLLRVALDALFVVGAAAFVRRALDGHFGMRDATAATLNEVRRSYRMILACEAAIVRARSRPELFDAICRVAVEDGGYVAAWIGLAQEDEDKSVLPAASAGKDAERASFVRPGFVTWADEPRGRGPTGTAIRTGRLCSIDDAAAAPQTAPWRELFARLRLGGAVSVPLTLRGTTLGALTLYGEDAGRLPEPERVLLENLAATIDYALDALDRREQEAARFEELRRLSHAVEFSPATIVITDANGAIEYVNRKFTEVTGYAREEVLGKNPNLLKSGATPKEEYSKLWTEISAGREWRGEFLNRAKDGRDFRESASISPIRDASGRISHYIAVKEDITARRALEEQLRQSQKLEAIGALAGGIAHDFNNILTVIRGHCTLLEGERVATATTRESIDEIVESVERASALTRQLLAFGRRQTMRPSEVHPNEPVSKMARMLRRVIPERIEIVVSPSAEPITVRADPAMLEQVVMNLVLNARDAIAGKGRVVVEVAKAPDADPGSRAPAAAHGWMVLRVRDDGAGIAEKDLGRIFEPFFTTKSLGKGTGLGLSVVDGIVRQHKGFVEVDSAPGRGTSVSVFLPVLPAGSLARDEAADRGPVPGGDETILLAEDEESLRRLSARYLKSLGYRVVEAPNGESALEAWRRSEGRISALITDMVMPGSVDGPGLVRALRAEAPDLRVVFVSGYHAAQDSVARDRRSVFLQKPFAPEELARVLRATLDAS